MTLRVAFFGTAARAQPYLRSLERMPDAALVAACDPDSRSAAAAALPWSARVFESQVRMLEDARPDALWICVEPQLQADAVDQAVALEVPFFILPPGALEYRRG